MVYQDLGVPLVQVYDIRYSYVYVVSVAIPLRHSIIITCCRYCVFVTHVVHLLAQDALQGYHCTLFAYGQTVRSAVLYIIILLYAVVVFSF